LLGRDFGVEVGGIEIERFFLTWGGTATAIA